MVIRAQTRLFHPGTEGAIYFLKNNPPVFFSQHCGFKGPSLENSRMETEHKAGCSLKSALGFHPTVELE